MQSIPTFTPRTNSCAGINLAMCTVFIIYTVLQSISLPMLNLKRTSDPVLAVGPIVRVGPNEVDVADINAAKEIHRVGGKYLKNEFYDNIGHRGSRTLFNETDSQRHAIRRKLLSAGMARTSIVQLESDVMQRIRLTIQRMQEENKDRGVIDVFKWWTFMAADVITQLSFGESFQTTEHGVVIYPLNTQH